MQSRFILFAHAAREVWIVEVLVAGALRHIFQHRQAILNGALAIRGHISPLWQHVVLDVIALRRRHLLPNARTIGKILPLRRA